VHRLVLLGHEHLAEPPFADRFDECVGADLRSWTFGDFVVGPRGDALGGPFEKTAIGLVNEQQGLEPGLERGIARAGPLDVTATSVRGLDLSGNVEDGGFVECLRNHGCTLTAWYVSLPY